MGNKLTGQYNLLPLYTTATQIHVKINKNIQAPNFSPILFSYLMHKDSVKSIHYYFILVLIQLHIIDLCSLLFTTNMYVYLL